MKNARIVSALLLILLVANATPFASPQDSGKTPLADSTFAAVADLAKVWLWSDDAAAREKALADLTARKMDDLVITKDQCARLADMIANGKEFKADVQKGLYKAEAPLGNGKTTVYYCGVPAGYDHRKPHPLILSLHGGPSPSEASCEQSSRISAQIWQKPADGSGYLLAAPRTTATWGIKSGAAIIQAVLFDMMSKYNVDCNRIYIYGISMGSMGCWEIGMGRPDRFAAVAPTCGSEIYTKEMLEYSFVNLPAFVVAGAKDTLIGRGGLGSAPLTERQKLNAETLKELGYVQEFVLGPRGHDPYVENFPRILKFYAEHPRNPYPAKIKKFIHPTFRAMVAPLFYSPMCYWLRVDNSEGDAKLSAEIAGNEVRIVSEGVKEYTIFLNDTMADLDKPVRVLVNGVVKFEGAVTRNLGTLLRSQETLRDRGRVFAASVKIAVTPPVKKPEGQ